MHTVSDGLTSHPIAVLPSDVGCDHKALDNGHKE
jgi:hypothetical protein